MGWLSNLGFNTTLILFEKFDNDPVQEQLQIRKRRQYHVTIHRIEKLVVLDTNTCRDSLLLQEGQFALPRPGEKALTVPASQALCSAYSSRAHHRGTNPLSPARVSSDRRSISRIRIAGMVR